MGTIEFVEWVDSKFIHGWYDPDDLEYEPTIIHSVGFVFLNNEDVLGLTSCVSDSTGNVGNPIIIPKSAIVQQVPLNWPQRESSKILQILKREDG